ncbi:P-loop containing nucleoside triphosphate hydrolase protein [Daldinia caldariorum]|uniref:P-loop containing nucleoside triphosphate hydrolase protein n=1 Tax=Daldinia caldariorum TaxID=326644 RepID=UPI0020086A12|nr:P-loop containing nucleoside triphosphate hydrolase protein [Daldinia caldariorum]KAI1468111.1 P-loop containing nucleoside triphosphate hydrolase protein [Daldinia caldariorum]
MSESESTWSEEEIRYFRALLAWVANDKEDDGDYEGLPPPERHVGQFMFLVLGDKGCGKTSLLEKFCCGTFAEEDRLSKPDEPERGYRHTISIEDQTYILNALELPSRHLSSEEQLTQAIQITEAVVLVYSVKSRSSFTLLQDVYNHIRDMVGETRMYGLMLVGTNSDCEDEQREVSWAEGRKLAASFGLGCAFLETSAKTGDNVNRIFPQLGREVLKLKWLNHQRKEEAERLSIDAKQRSIDIASLKGVTGWRSWTRPWFQRRAGDRKASSPC